MLGFWSEEVSMFLSQVIPRILLEDGGSPPET